MIELGGEFDDFSIDDRMSPKDDRMWNPSNIEFDGTTVLCRVCGDKASGFHYGVHSCEGCKGFFRRSIQQKIQYRPCTKNQQCSILRVNRNRCQYCRLKKCIAVGMSRDAVRFGRVPKREKAKILAAMQSVNARCQEKALAVELEDEAKLVGTIVKAHDDTCDYTKDKIVPLLQRARANPVYTQCTPQLACPLNPNPHSLQNGNQRVLEDFSERFSPAIRGVVEFAKRIPGFGLLSQDDQVTLLKAGVFEVLLVRLACMFDSRTNTMICLNGQVLKRESLQHTSNARFLMDSMFDFAERVNMLQLLDSELGLFCAMVVIAPDRPGLRNVELVKRMQGKMMEALDVMVAHNHPQSPSMFQELMKKIPDLRTLNTLHSEKLLAFKMEPHTETSAMQTAAPSSTAAPNQTNMHALYQTQVGHWGTYKSPHDITNDDSKGSWDQDHDRMIPSPSLHHQLHHRHQPTSTEAMSWSPASSSAKDQDLYENPRSTEGGNSFIIDDGANSKSPLGSSGSSASLKSDNDGELNRRGNGRNEGGNSSGDECSATESPNNKCPYKIRKLDSPTDSGIESGKELGSSGNHSRSTSICSSPRSSLDDKVKDVSDCEPGVVKHESIIDDMPVLKRALQAPPLINTNLLMDEAYKPHKKFRALRKDSDSTPTSPEAPGPQGNTINCATATHHRHQQPQPQQQQQQQQQHHHLQLLQQQQQQQQQLQLHHQQQPQPTSLASMHNNNATLASTHSTLVKSLEQSPRMSEQQLKRTDIIHNIIMRSEGQQRRSTVDLQPSSPQQQQQQQQQQYYNGHQIPTTTATLMYSMPQVSVAGPALAAFGVSKNPTCQSGYYIPQSLSSSSAVNQSYPMTSWPSYIGNSNSPNSVVVSAASASPNSSSSRSPSTSSSSYVGLPSHQRAAVSPSVLQQQQQQQRPSVQYQFSSPQPPQRGSTSPNLQTTYYTNMRSSVSPTSRMTPPTSSSTTTTTTSHLQQHLLKNTSSINTVPSNYVKSSSPIVGQILSERLSSPLNVSVNGGGGGGRDRDNLPLNLSKKVASPPPSLHILESVLLGHSPQRVKLESA